MTRSPMDPGKPISAEAATSPAIEAELKRAAGPCWAIDAQRALLVAANGAGAARLGLTAAPGAGLPLDPSMPAIRSLRQIASEIAPGTSRIETLVVVTAHGEETLTCDVRRLADAPQVLIVAASEPLRAPAIGALSDPERHEPGEAHGEAVPREEPRRQRSDSETLAEIARRIREAQQMMRKASHAAANSANAAAPVHETGPAAPPSAPASDRTSHQARLAHELRTPLSAIVAAAEIMKDERFGPLGDERYRGYAADIHESARHALGVINAMLGGRSETSHDTGAPALPQLQFAEIDINAIAESAVSSMQPLAAAAALELRLQPAPRLPHVVADAVSIRQIILNLLTNALKFTGPGGRIVVSTSYRPETSLELSVEDNGRGMTRAQIERVLGARPDSEMDRTSPRMPGSLGIGLSVVRTLARANGGTVSIESSAGQGARVSITFDRDRIIPI